MIRDGLNFLFQNSWHCERLPRMVLTRDRGRFRPPPCRDRAAAGHRGGHLWSDPRAASARVSCSYFFCAPEFSAENLQ